MQDKSNGESKTSPAELPNKKVVMKKNNGVRGFIGTTYGVYNLADGKLLKIFTNKQDAIDFTNKQNASSAKSIYKIDFNNYDEDIDWDTAEKNEKINGNKGKNEKRKDKYGNPLVSDEAFNVGVDAVKGYLDYMSKDGYNHQKLKTSNIYTDALENVISKAITEAGYNPGSDLTETDFNEIIGAATGEEYKTESDRTGSGYKKWTGKSYTGYSPEMKAGFDKFYKKAIDTFVETKKRQPNKDELNALRQTAQITTALSLLSQKYNT